MRMPSTKILGSRASARNAIHGKKSHSLKITICFTSLSTEKKIHMCSPLVKELTEKGLLPGAELAWQMLVPVICLLT